MYLGWDAFSHEVVPQEVRGKYLGMRAVIVGIIGVIAPLLGGIIWSINLTIFGGLTLFNGP